MAKQIFNVQKQIWETTEGTVKDWEVQPTESNNNQVTNTTSNNSSNNNRSSNNSVPYAYTPPTPEELQNIKIISIEPPKPTKVIQIGGNTRADGLVEVPVSATATATKLVTPKEAEEIKASYKRSAEAGKVDFTDLLLFNPSNIAKAIGGGFLSGFVVKQVPTTASKAVVPVVERTLTGIGTPSIYKGVIENVAAGKGKDVAISGIKGAAKYFAEHPYQGGAFGIAQGIIGADVFRGISANVTTKPEELSKVSEEVYQESLTSGFQTEDLLKKKTVTKTPRELDAKTEYFNKVQSEALAAGKSSNEAKRLAEEAVAPKMFFAPEGQVFEKTGTRTIVVPQEFTFDNGKSKMTIDDITYENKYPSANIPLLGEFSAIDILPQSQLYMPESKENFLKGTKKVLMEKGGLSEAEASKVAEYQYGVELQSRGVGGLIGLGGIGIGEEQIASGMFKSKIMPFVAEVTKKGLTIPKAKALVTKELFVPLIVSGSAGGASTVINQERSKAEPINLIDVGKGAITGAGSAVTLGIPVARWAMGGAVQQVASKGLYWGASGLFDWVEPVADITVSKVRKFGGVSDIGIPIKTWTVTPTTTKTPTSNKELDTKINQIINTPITTTTGTTTNNPTITPNNTITGTFTPSYINSFTPTPIDSFTPTITPTETITPTVTPTITPTVTSTITPTVTPTITPTFTAYGLPFIPPIAPTGDAGSKSSRRERTRFIDEFTAAFSGLARPSQPTYFGKQKPIKLTEKMYKPKRTKKTLRGVNFAAMFI